MQPQGTGKHTPLTLLFMAGHFRRQVRIPVKSTEPNQSLSQFVMPPHSGEEETLIKHVEYLDKARTKVYDYEVITRGNAKLQNGLTVFTAAVFIVAQVAGSGVLALPAAIVGAGWTGFGLLVICWLASGYCGTILGRSWVILRERHDEYKSHVRNPYPAIGEKAYGRWASLAVTISINLTLIGKTFLT